MYRLQAFVFSLFPRKWETPEEKQSTKDDRSVKKAKISLPTEIIEEILSRFPVKSLLQFKSVSKPWFFLISDPSFAKLHFPHAIAGRRTTLFISAYDPATHEQHFLSAPRDGGSVTHLMTIQNPRFTDGRFTEAEHLNGLVFFTSGNGFIENNFAFLLNPCTRKIFKLPYPANVPLHTYGVVHVFNFFGFDELRNEHKILNMTMLSIPPTTPYKPSKHTTKEFMIFSLSTYSWSKIEVELPIDISNEHWYYCGTTHSVCVNSAIHLILRGKNVILAFDLRTEKFSIINTPRDAMPHESITWYVKKGMNRLKTNYPFLMKINGLLGVVCHDHVVESNKMHIWILQDYENRVWVKKTITFSESWIKLDEPFPLDVVDMDKIVFSSKRLSRNKISVPMYDMKTRSFKSVDFTHGHKFLHSKTIEFNQVRSYVESIWPLETNETRT